MKHNRSRPFATVVIFFILLNAFFISGRNRLESWGFDQDVLIYGNLILFIITFSSYIIALRGLKASNPNAFVRGITASIMLKMLICLVAAFVYIFMNRENINKQSLFACMGLYLVYTFIEVAILMKLAKQKVNA
ncbi:MAG: hypothetical protein M3O67_10020 [Bacteroidota bacterium]|nr:hypothetical protein [Bacteroidota bacterium]